jgi:hypothetical protein
MIMLTQVTPSLLWLGAKLDVGNYPPFFFGVSMEILIILMEILKYRNLHGDSKKNPFFLRNLHGNLHGDSKKTSAMLATRKIPPLSPTVRRRNIVDSLRV